ERAAHGVVLTLVINEVEQLVFFEWSAQAGAILLQGHWRLVTYRRGSGAGRLIRIIEKIARVKRGFAAKCKRGAVNRVAARLDSGVDDGPGFPAKFGLRILLGIEFLNGVDGKRRGRVTRGDDRIR